MVFGHLEVLHAKFHDRTISNLGDYVAQTDRQTNTQTDRQTDNANYYVDKTDIHWPFRVYRKVSLVATFYSLTKRFELVMLQLGILFDIL